MLLAEIVSDRRDISWIHHLPLLLHIAFLGNNHVNSGPFSVKGRLGRQNGWKKIYFLFRRNLLDKIDFQRNNIFSLSQTFTRTQWNFCLILRNFYYHFEIKCPVNSQNVTKFWKYVAKCVLQPKNVLFLAIQYLVFMCYDS